MKTDTDHQVFPLTTLRDIFELPTLDQMVTCLDEIKECMIQVRLANDIIVAAIKDRGVSVDKALEWPEILDWKDDGKGEIGFKIVCSDHES